MNARLMAARIIETARDYPSAVGPGELALVTEVNIAREQRDTDAGALRVWREAACRWREKCIAARLALAQARGELEMARVELEGYRRAFGTGERHD